MEPFDYFEELSNCQHLFLETMSEPRTNSVKIKVNEGRASELTIPIEVSRQSLAEGLPVNIDDTCATYELTWNSYVLYQVTNESFGRKEETRDGILGSLANIYRSSRLLDCI